MLVLAAALLAVLIKPLPTRAALGSKIAPKRHMIKHLRSRRRHLTAVPHELPTFGHKIVSYARRFLGTPYVWGGTSPRYGFDCSGFVRYVYGHFGIALPHSSFADLWRGRHIGRRYLKPGDLVFFDGASHVGIYVGSDRMIDAPHTGSVVRISTMNGWYGETYDGARRLGPAPR
ncbi:MAG TPA: C40 family peptidase [Gaiellaceae bacterium]|nr:C40 family peptidase [Gaiellaceae bacterium]